MEDLSVNQTSKVSVFKETGCQQLAPVFSVL